MARAGACSNAFQGLANPLTRALLKELRAVDTERGNAKEASHAAGGSMRNCDGLCRPELFGLPLKASRSNRVARWQKAESNSIRAFEWSSCRSSKALQRDSRSHTDPKFRFASFQRQRDRAPSTAKMLLSVSSPEPHTDAIPDDRLLSRARSRSPLWPRSLSCPRRQWCSAMTRACSA